MCRRLFARARDLPRDLCILWQPIVHGWQSPRRGIGSRITVVWFDPSISDQLIWEFPFWRSALTTIADVRSPRKRFPR